MSFPDFDFKIDCGDDPAVRQWLHDNGCVFSYFGKTISDIKADEKHLCCDIKNKIVLTFDPNNLGLISQDAKHINPFDYMQPEKKMTIRNRRSAKYYDEGYQCGWIEAKSDYKERLRDEFAMAALQGLLSDPTLDMIYHETASLAYGYADAMMKARKEVPE